MLRRGGIKDMTSSEVKLNLAMAIVTILLVCLSVAFAPSEWGAECIVGSIVVPGVILWVVEKLAR
jgi:hypothetical protein